MRLGRLGLHLLAIAAVLNAGCTPVPRGPDPDESAAMAMVREGMRDPDGVKFRSVEHASIPIACIGANENATAECKRVTICGEYNATNVYNAYVGFVGFKAVKEADGRWHWGAGKPNNPYPDWLITECGAGDLSMRAMGLTQPEMDRIKREAAAQINASSKTH